MVSYPAVMRLRPGFKDFMRTSNLVHRGDALAFRGNLRTPFFTTDEFGFRRTVHDGRPLSVEEAFTHQRYGIVLGSSHIFGIGVVGDENTLPSVLSAHFGFPFANASIPEGNSRNLYALLTSFTARMSRPPAVVVHFSGGDFTSFSYASMSDAVFGSPNLKQVAMVHQERGGCPVASESVQSLLAFTSLWTRSIVALCRRHRIPVLLGHDTTFFEKAEPSPLERESKLGVPTTGMQQQWFANHRQVFPQFLERREALAAALGVPLAGPGPSNELTFVDEFHYDREGALGLAQDIARGIEPLLG